MHIKHEHKLQSEASKYPFVDLLYSQPLHTNRSSHFYVLYQ